MHPNNLTIRLLLCVFLIGPATAWAALPLVTDDTGTQGKSTFQIEASGTWIHDKQRESGMEEREVSTLATIAFTAGVAETVDVIVTVPYVWTESNESGQDIRYSGIFDTVLEAKWRFYEMEKFSIAIKPGIIIPTGDEDKGLGTGHLGYSASLISTMETAPWSFHANLGYLYLPNSSDDRTGIWLGSLAGMFSAAEKWKLVGEIGATRNSDADRSAYPAFAQIGLIYSPKETLDLSAGYLLGINSADLENAVRAGVTVRF